MRDAQTSPVPDDRGDAANRPLRAGLTSGVHARVDVCDDEPREDGRPGSAHLLGHRPCFPRNGHDEHDCDRSLAQTRKLLVAMFTEYRKAMEQRAKHRDSGNQIYQTYGLANFAHDVLLKAEPELSKRGCDVSSLL